MLFEPAQLEPLTDELWDPARVEDAIATIVADADAAFDPEALSPAHDWDGWRAPLPMKNLYVGAAGVIWALDALRRRGHAETSLDLTAAALRTLDLERAERDFGSTRELARRQHEWLLSVILQSFDVDRREVADGGSLDDGAFPGEA
jgi:hypothetical protein